MLGGGLVEGLLEGLEVAEISGDLGGNGAGGRAADAVGADRTHQLPKYSVIGVATGVIFDASANLFGNLCQIADEVVDGLGGQLGVVGEQCIEVVDVGLVVLVVMNLHRLGVDERFEGGVVVRQRCEFVRHKGKSPSSWVFRALLRWGSCLGLFGRAGAAGRCCACQSSAEPYIEWMLEEALRCGKVRRDGLPRKKKCLQKCVTGLQ